MKVVAYIRKSKLNPNGHGLSWEVQESQVRQLAAKHGNPEIEIVTDWGASGAAAAGAFGGTSRGGKRRAWQQLLVAIDAGEISTLYAYSLSRLARSTKELLELAERCAKAHVVIRLAKEGELDWTSPHGRFYLTVLGAVATMEAEQSADKARDQVALRRSRGDYIGQPPYGFHVVDGKLEPDPEQPIAPVLEAYREAGSYHGAARLLNGQRSSRKVRWSDMTVRRVVARAEGAEHRSAPVGRPRLRAALLSGLLRCPCGTTLTPVRDNHRLATGQTTTYTSYICWRGRHDSDHPRPFKVTETALLPWIREEADRLQVPANAVETQGDPARQDELLGRRQRVIDNYEDGLIGKDVRDEKIAAIDAELDRLTAVSSAVLAVPPAIDWTWEPERLNNVLRALWDHVDVDEGLRPVSAEWTVFEWRTA